MSRRALGIGMLTGISIVATIAACGGGAALPDQLGAYEGAGPDIKGQNPVGNQNPAGNGNPSTVVTPGGGGGCPPCNETLLCTTPKSNGQDGQSQNQTSTVTLATQNGQCVVLGDQGTDNVVVVLACGGAITGNGQVGGTWSSTGNGGITVTTTETTTVSTSGVGSDAAPTTTTTTQTNVYTCVPTTASGPTDAGQQSQNALDGAATP